MRFFLAASIVTAWASSSAACLDFDVLEPPSSTATTSAGGGTSSGSNTGTGADGGKSTTSATGGAGGETTASSSTGTMCGNDVVESGEECEDALAPAGACVGCSVVCSGADEHKEPVSGHCYKLFSSPLDWPGARDACEDWRTGAIIAVVTSQAEQDFIASFIVYTTFLGAQLDRGAWAWMNDEPFAFEAWENGQGISGEEDCVAMWEGQPPWHDVECWYPARYVCEWPP